MGVNYRLLPTKAARNSSRCRIERDGLMNFTSDYDADPIYLGSRLKPMKFSNLNIFGHAVTSTDLMDFASPQAKMTITKLSEKNLDDVQMTTPILSFPEVDKDKDFEQARVLWTKFMSKQEGAQARFVDNAAAHVGGVIE